MVQNRPPLPQRDPFSRDWSQASRSYHDCDPSPNEARPNISLVHTRVLSVEDALRDCAKINAKAFGLIVITEDGQQHVFSSPSLLDQHDRIFPDRFKEDFERAVRRVDDETPYSSQAYNQDGLYSDFDLDSRQYNRKMSGSGESSSGSRRSHQRRQNIVIDSDDERDRTTKRSKRQRNERPMIPITEKKTMSLKIGDKGEVEKFYFVRFKDMQQNACKIIGKAFVKLLEPKKQTHYPYTKGADKAPPWWPNTKGDNAVRHREPDHLLKAERIRLLVHIVQMVVAPAKEQWESVSKLGLNVKKLEEVTMEATSNWFNDKEHPNNAKKKPYLKEIFKVAKAEERFNRGECDATSLVYVMYGDSKTGLADPQDDSEDEALKYEDEYEPDDDTLNNTSIPTPESLVSNSMQNQQLQNRGEHDNMYRLPLRHAFPPPESHASFVDGPPSYQQSFHHQQHSPTFQDPSPRSFASSSFQSPQPNGFNWTPNSMATNSPISASYYTTSPQTFSSSIGSYQLPPPNTQPPSMHSHPSHSFDGLPSHSPMRSSQFDLRPSINTQLRTGSLGHPHHLTGHGSYDDYLGQNDSGYGGHEQEMKHDQHMGQS